MRDTLKDVKYFNEFIDEELERVAKFSEKLKNADVKQERILPVKTKIHDLKLGILVAQYSQGETISKLRDQFIRLVNEWKDVWQPDFYNKNLKMISLSVLFRIDDFYAAIIRELFKQSDIKDWLFDYLINSFGSKQMLENEELLFPESFSTLKNLVIKENKIELLNKYLTAEWYNEDCGCYEAHKSKQKIYYGYWAFEAGAIAKILKLDDTELKDVPYYPYDLVHYQE